MKSWPYKMLYGREAFGKEAGPLLSVLKDCKSLSQARERLIRKVSQIYAKTFEGRPSPPAHELIRARDCARALLAVADARSDARAGFSVTQAMWDELARAAKWSRANSDVLVDTHWIGGNPGKAEVYGWASWRPGKGILTLRNPSDKPREFSLTPRAALELPAEVRGAVRLEAIYPQKQQTPAGAIGVEETLKLSLKPFEVVVMELAGAERAK